MKIKTFVTGFFTGDGYEEAFKRLDRYVQDELDKSVKIHSSEDKLFPSSTTSKEAVDISPKLVRVVIYD